MYFTINDKEEDTCGLAKIKSSDNFLMGKLAKFEPTHLHYCQYNVRLEVLGVLYFKNRLFSSNYWHIV